VCLLYRYCSDLYPSATAYRRCNWCLAQGGGAQALARKTADKRKAAASTDASTSEEEQEGEGVCRQSHEAARCATTRSRRPAAEVGRPVKKLKAGDRAVMSPTSPGAAAKGNNGTRKHKADGPPSPVGAKGNNGAKKHKADEPPSPVAPKGYNSTKKHKADERAALPPSPCATANGDKYSGEKKSMQAGKLARPGRVKVRRYKLLTEVISC
jgi:hypothetical protein